MLRVVKLTVGAIIAIFVAQWFDLFSGLTAGTVVLLSLKNTWKTSLELVVIRIKAIIIATLIASASLLLFGFNVWGFALFLLIFVPLALKLDLEDGLVIAVVLSSHLVARGEVTVPVLVNTGALFIIGVGIALIFNLYMPDLTKQIEAEKVAIDENFKEILLVISTILLGDQNFDMSVIDLTKKQLEQAINIAKQNEENYMHKSVARHTDYLQMRRQQLRLLTHMMRLASQVNMTLFHTQMIAQLTKDFALSLSEDNTGEDLLLRVEDIRTFARQSELPKTRREFENRAILFQYLSEFTHMVELKWHFMNESVNTNV